MMTWGRLLNNSRPRRSTIANDVRSEFERDFDRVVFSTPVKRLQDKAQVFPLEPHDAIRTRLTHSLEVSSVARGLALAVARWLLERDLIGAAMARDIEAIAATCGLIHDLGNPPFGHAGEDAIREWFTEYLGEERLRKLVGDNEQRVQDFLRFEGNAQTLRLVTKLQILADYNGLNLTYGTLSALCKYLAPSHLVGSREDDAWKKPGFFASENALIETIRQEVGSGEARNPITFLVEAADDIVYSIADIEDGVKKGILNWHDLKKWLDEAGIVKAGEALKRKDNILKAGGAAVPAELPGDFHASALRTAAIGIMVESAVETFKKRYEEIMNGAYKMNLVKDGDAAEFVQLLKRIGQEHVYCTAATLKLELMGRKVINDLLGFFWEGAKELPIGNAPKTTHFPGKIGALLSDSYRRVYQNSVQTMPCLPEMYHRLQLLTDYICGMTDSFSQRLHAELTNG